MKVSLTSLFIIKSTYLFLSLVSTSVNPWNFSGRALKFLESNSNELALKVSSPVLVMKISPSTPIISPTPIFLTTSNTFYPSASCLKYT